MARKPSRQTGRTRSAPTRKTSAAPRSPPRKALRKAQPGPQSKRGGERGARRSKPPGKAKGRGTVKSPLPARSTSKGGGPGKRAIARAKALRAEAARRGHQTRRIRRRRHGTASKLGAWRKQRAQGDDRADAVRALGGKVKLGKPRRKGDPPPVSVVIDDLPFGLAPEDIGEIAEQAAFEARSQVDELGPRAWQAYRFQWTIWKLHSRFGSREEAEEEAEEQGEHVDEWSDERTVSSSYRKWQAFASTIAQHVRRSSAPRDTDSSRRIWVFRVAVYAIPFRDRG